ncbi:MAG: hypothetical protein IPF79_05640 [Ignavibacteria bacterium]|nr:hypothetical protein [Ignavibacteria bacterium]
MRTGLITFTSLLFGNDYGDYYYRTGGEVGIGYTWGQLPGSSVMILVTSSGIRFFVRSDDHRSATSIPAWSLFKPRCRTARESFDLRRNDENNGTYPYVGLFTDQTDLEDRNVVERGNITPWDPCFELRFHKGIMDRCVALEDMPLWTLDVVATAGWS